VEAVSERQQSGADIAELADISLQDESVLAQIAATRAIVRFARGESKGPYFKGNGLIVVGNQEGILGFDYSSSSPDPVAERYGKYQWAGALKLGRAALLQRSGLVEDCFVEANKWLDAQVGKDSEEPPHHLGYSWRKQGNLQVAVGATGMLASDMHAREREMSEAQILRMDEARKWVTWQGDRFAGYDDMFAARSVAQQVIGGEVWPAMQTIGKLHRAGVNLH